MKKEKRGQVTVFVILAVLIVGGVVAYFSLRGGVGSEVPKSLEPVYNYYLECLKEHALTGAEILGEQGGYIETPEFVPGSQYMPFSSQLEFFGQPIPYWMYVSGNNLLKEQVPSKADMENGLENYVRQRVDDCDFSDFNKQGYDVFVDLTGEADVDVKIEDYDIKVNVDSMINIYFQNDSAVVTKHNIQIDSKLGKFYGLALDVYNFEKKNMFLEQYALDVMRLYAPVDGIELSCSPKVFVDEIIRQNLSQGLEANIGMLKLKGDYYKLSGKENEYFATDIGTDVDENVNFVYSPDWTTRIEIYGNRIAEPVGLQEGLGILGFCYVPYHLVYDIDFPVLIQFYDEKELFQFPVGVVIDKGQAREALPSVAGTSIESEVCKYKNQDVVVYTYDWQLNPVEADIKFKCLDTECRIGTTEFAGNDAVLDAKMPQCVNGFVLASADGYADAKYQISTNEESTANIVLNKLYNISLDLGDVDVAWVSFVSDDYSKNVFYPDMKDVELIAGYYNVSVLVYKNSTLTFPAVNERKCVDVPKSGIGGLLGQEEEKCFDVNLPEQDAVFAVVGGGRTEDYFTENQLESSRELNINAPLFGTPASLDELQMNYIRAEDEVVYLDFE